MHQLEAALADRYRIGRELGVGGMATVYLARDLKHDRDVAIKVLHPAIAASLGHERFLAEIKTTARLHHPHILPLYDSGEAGGHLFYVMPLVEGESLRERLTREKVIPADDALRIIREVADALGYAHAHEIIHRDVKPENIMLEGGHALVADFGIARAHSGSEQGRLTQAGSTLGTPVYMSPEQAAGDSCLDCRCDLYSLACVLFEMLTGEPPFTGATPEAILVQRFTRSAPRVSSRLGAVPAAVDAAVARALARDPDGRFASVADFARALGERPHATLEVEKSIAVLPFVNMSTDPENEFFSDGIAEEIINALTQVPSLRVAARTSAFSFKGKNEDLRAVGDRLGVSAVLEGSVRRAGSRLRITAQLIDVASGHHLWSERYDRELTDVFAIQDEIAGAIVSKLVLTMGDQGGKPLVQPPTANIEAYERYLKGRALLLQRGQGIRHALECFAAATRLDPSFAAAHAAFGEALTLLAHFGLRPATSVMPEARAAVERALALNPALAEAHATRALIALTWDRDRTAAAASWEQALALNPVLVPALATHGNWFLGMVEARFDDAERDLLRAVALDPLSAYAHASYAMTLALAGRGPEAVAEADRAVELDPASFLARWVSQIAYDRAGLVEEAIAAGTEAAQMSGRHPWTLGLLASTLASAGRVTDAEAIHDELLARSRREYVQSSSLAQTACFIGKVEDAIGFLRQAEAERETPLTMLVLHWPYLDPLRGHAGFREVLERIGWT